MKIEWMGHACFQISCGKERILIDPFDPEIVPGYRQEIIEVERVLCSHAHGDHNYTRNVRLSGIPLQAFAIQKLLTYHDECQGRERGNNAIHILEANDFRIVHMGDIGCDLTEEQIQVLKHVDVCMVPVGGIYTIDSEKARQMMAKISPGVIVPMHYRDGAAGVQELAPVEQFTALYPTEMVHHLSDNVWDTEREPLRGVVVFDSARMRKE